MTCNVADFAADYWWIRNCGFQNLQQQIQMTECRCLANFLAKIFHSKPDPLPLPANLLYAGIRLRWFVCIHADASLGLEAVDTKKKRNRFFWNVENPQSFYFILDALKQSKMNFRKGAHKKLSPLASWGMSVGISATPGLSSYSRAGSRMTPTLCSKTFLVVQRIFPFCLE